MAQLPLLECVPVAVRGNPRYVGDHVIRHYRPLGLSALLRDLGLPPCESYTVSGGIGTLTMYADGREDWRPTIPDAPRQPAAQPRPASAEMEADRRTACLLCESFRDAKCSAAGCGCAGEGKPAVWSSRCPLGRWPT